MAEEPKNDVAESDASTDTENKKTEKKKGLLSRIWGAIFRGHGEDLEKRLQYISKEEATVLARIKRRTNNCHWWARRLIIFSVISEVIAVGYGIMTTRSLNLDWKMRAVRVLPMFLLPALSFITYSTFRSISRIRDKRDHNTLEKLRSERKEKIDELKEKTNYYITQQLIQRYDTDPAAKAAAASVLASKLGADSGLKVYLGDDSNPNSPTGKSNDVELPSASGLRNRKQPNTSSHPGEGMLILPNEFDGDDVSQQNQLVAGNPPQAGMSSTDGGWISRLAALLVGEDPTQCYALICGNCHMHNGLARREDYPYITYYCPHCKFLNRPKESDSGSVIVPASMNVSLETADDVPVVTSPGGLGEEKVSPSDSVVDGGSETSSSTSEPVDKDKDSLRSTSEPVDKDSKDSLSSTSEPVDKDSLSSTSEPADKDSVSSTSEPVDKD